MDIFLDYCVKPFLKAKESNSRSIALTSPKMPLPKFNSVDEINDYIQNNFKYKADPIAFDYYTNPETIEYGLKTGQAGKFDCDCDDYATFAWLAIDRLNTQNGIKLNPRIMNLIIDPIEIWNISWCHVICVFEYKDINNNLLYGIIDTNGLHWNNSLDGIKNFFSLLYKVNYKYFIEVLYPFI